MLMKSSLLVAYRTSSPFATGGEKRERQHSHSVLQCVAMSYGEASRRDSTLLPTRDTYNMCVVLEVVAVVASVRLMLQA